MKPIRLSSAHVGEPELKALSNLLCPNTYLGMGDEVLHFEAELANYLGIHEKYVVAVNSGTAALHLACTTSCTKGHEIIVPSLTYVATLQAISAAGCKPNFCDVNIHTATLDLEHAKSIVNAKTKAIMPMHYAGNSHNLDAIHHFATKHNLRVIEDAAHAFGCTHEGKKIGSFGDLICFSFDGIKNITCAEGGAIIAFNDEDAKYCRQARNLGIVKADNDFDVNNQGWRYHMSNIFACIGRVQLSRLHSEFAPKRQDLAKIYYNELKTLAQNNKIAFLHFDQTNEIIPHIFALRILHGQRNRLKSALAALHIETAIHYKPSHLLTYYKSECILPRTMQLYSELISLPLHVEMQKEDIQYICHNIQKILN